MTLPHHDHAAAQTVQQQRGDTFTIVYVDATRLSDVLADMRTLAVFAFGSDVPDDIADPRLIRVGLQPHRPALLEVWRGAGPVRHGRDRAITWLTDGQLSVGHMDIDEPHGTDISTAAAQAYALLDDHLAGADHPHLLRIWNYLDAVTDGEGDAERYRRFCVGRVQGMRRLDETRLPAATCIGRHDGVRRLQVYWLSGPTPGLPLENPRQISAYRYPRQYGPQAPSFARALLPPADSGLPLLLSGTAAILGHASQHVGAVAVQLREVLANLNTLVDTARQHDAALPPALDAGSPLKVYVRDAADLPVVEAELQALLPDSVPRIVLHGEVCRSELLVEIEGMHGAWVPSSHTR